MTRIRLRHVDRFTDRNGHTRHYFRRAKGPRIPLPGAPGSAEFMAAYNVAVDGVAIAKPTKLRGAAGTFDRLTQDYFASLDFARLRASTQSDYRSAIERYIAQEGIGHRLVAGMTREHVGRMVARRKDRPAAGNDLLKKMKILMGFAVANNWRRDDPTFRLKGYQGGEHHTWTEEEIATFEVHWPMGSKERTSFALHLWTGQRLSDVCRMSWRDLNGSSGIQVVQGKGGAKVWIPLHEELATVLAAWPRTHVVILPTGQGKPYTVRSFGKWMAKAIDAAKVPSRCVTHGLRKAAARRLAEAGCSAHQIMAITGHKTLQEVERYTRAAEQRRLAIGAINQLPVRSANAAFPNQSKRLGN